MALVRISIAIGFQIGKSQAAAVRAAEILVLLVPSMTQRDQNLLGSLDQLNELRPLTTEGHADRVLTVRVLMLQEISNHSVRFPASTRASEADIIAGARDELLLLRLRLPMDYWRVSVVGAV